jgi:hypothetical protein
MSNNPLIAAYKKPALYVSLPSKGRFYDPAPKLSVDNELAVYAMTARDELISKTPDALFNGEATVALLESCCPDIENPRQIPVNDLIVLMLAIRQASYGKDLDVDLQCPSCESLNMLSIDATKLLAKVKQNDTDNCVLLDNNFKVKLKPYNLEDRTLLQIQQIKQQKLIQGLVNSKLDESDKTKRFGETFVELADLTINLIANCIISVQGPETEEISDRDLILEWLKTINKRDYDTIRDRVEQLSDSGLDTVFKAQCTSCQHEWSTDVELDMANFFAG